MEIALVAVQAALDPARFRTCQAFRSWLLASAERAVEGLPPARDVPRLLAFPEMIGMALPWLLDRPVHARDAEGAAHRVGELVRREAGALLRDAFRRGRLGPSSLHQPRAVASARCYHGAFTEVARAAEATVVAGTLPGPAVTFEATRGWHVHDARVRNRAHAFAPNGAWIAVSDKVYLAAGAESRMGTGGGRIQDLRPLTTPVGPVAIAVCLDAFFDEVVARLDGQGTRILVQPSANAAPWDRPWPADPRLREGEAWMRFGLARALGGAASLRYGVNPMAVGRVLGFAPRGRSTIMAGPEAPGGARCVAIAERADAEEVVRAVVPAPW